VILELIEQRPADKPKPKRLEWLSLIEGSGKDREEGKCKVAGLAVAGTLVCWWVRLAEPDEYRRIQEAWVGEE